MAIECPLDEVVLIDVITSHPTTGATTDADSTPTFAVYEETTDTDIGVGGNFTKRTSLTGNYRGQFTASAANGFELGKFYSVIASGTVNAIAGKCVVRTFRIIGAETTAGIPDVNAKQLGGAVPGSATVGTVTTLTNAPGDSSGITTLLSRIASALTLNSGKVTVGTNDDKTGYGLSAGAAQAIWDALTAALTTAGSIGKLLVDNVNATISSRSSHSAADVWAAGTRTLSSYGTLVADTAAAVWDRLTSALTTVGSIGKLLVDRIDAAITSRAAAGAQMDIVNAPNATAVAAIQSGLATSAAVGGVQSDTNDLQVQIGVAGAGLTALGDTRLANLNATVSSRMATFSLPSNFATLAIDGSGRVTLVPAQIVIKKNTALNNFTFPMNNPSDHVSPLAGLTVTAQRRIDGGSFAACANAVTEVSGGYYTINFAASDFNGDIIMVKLTAPGGDTRSFLVLTQP